MLECETLTEQFVATAHDVSRVEGGPCERDSVNGRSLNQRMLVTQMSEDQEDLAPGLPVVAALMGNE